MGPALEYPAGGGGDQTLGWRWIFLINLPVGGLGRLALALWFIPRMPRSLLSFA